MRQIARHNYLVHIGQISLCAFFLLLRPHSIGQTPASIKPAICNPPTMSGPTTVTASPVSVRAVPSTAINVRLSGAWGDGQHVDGPLIQEIIDSNPNGFIYLPPGLYKLDNASANVTGLTFQNFHGHFFMFNGARLLCDNATTSAGQCVQITSSSNATFDNLRIGYTDESGLPLSRQNATSNALLVTVSTNIVFTNTNVEASTGSGFWISNSNQIQLNGGTFVYNTAADGLHFENTGSSSVTGYTADNTGDDALGVTNIATINPNCGLTASNIRVNNSHSRGIAVAGACSATFSNFAVDMTANSGIASTQDPSIASRIPTDIHFSNGVVSRAGQYTTTVDGSKDCVDIADSTNSSVSGVTCTAPVGDGVFVFGNANNISVDTVVVNEAGSAGFQAAGSTNVSFTNDVTRSAAAGGYSLQQVSQGVISGSYSCSSVGYGFYHSRSSGITESSLQSYDDGQGNSRVWWAEQMSGTISLNGINVANDIAQPQPLVIGGWDNPPQSVTINNVQSEILYGTLVVQP